MHLFASCFAALGALLTLSACLDPTQATLVITTNVDCGTELPAQGTLFETGLNAAATQASASAELATTTRSCTPRESGIHDVGEIVVFPESGATGASVIVVAALDLSTTAERCLTFARTGDTSDVTFDPRSCIVARRTVAFAEHTMLQIPILLDRFCAGVACADGSTCVHVGDNETACVDDKPDCNGASCDQPHGGGIPVGGGGSGGAGGSSPIPVDCGTYQPVFSDAGRTLDAVFGFSLPDSEPAELVLAARDANLQPLLFGYAGGELQLLSSLDSPVVAIHGVLDPIAYDKRIGLAEQDFGELLAPSVPDSAWVPGAMTDVFVALPNVAYFAGGHAELVILPLQGQTEVYSFDEAAPAPPELRAVTATPARAFGAGSHVCWGAEPTDRYCGEALTNPWVDAWAVADDELIGVTADGHIRHSDALGAPIQNDAQVPAASTVAVSLAKLQGVLNTAGLRVFWVAGGAGPNNEAYLARGRQGDQTYTWKECFLPGLGAVTDFWVSPNESEVYFISGGVLYRLLPAP